MVPILIALTLLAATAKPAPAPPAVPLEHRLRCEDAQRLYDALVAAKVPVKADGDAKTLSLPKLYCTWHSGGAYDPPTKSFVECEAPKVKAEAAMRIHEALVAAGIPGDIGMQRLALGLKDVVCKSTPAGTECTMTNALATADDVNKRDVREGDHKPKCEKR
ncbi:MAG TPA: hypothetical protein VGK67_09525 [Myxococcales bacterium]|jgi:hypothetical protein